MTDMNFVGLVLYGNANNLDRLKTRCEEFGFKDTKEKVETTIRKLQPGSEDLTCGSVVCRCTIPELGNLYTELGKDFENQELEVTVKKII